MNQSCDDPLKLEELLDYLNGELSEPDEQVLESHLFRCTRCAAEAERLGGLAAAIGTSIPPILSSSRFTGLERDGRIEKVNVMAPGQTAVVRYPEAGRLLVHRFSLSGVDLSRAKRIDIDLTLPGGEAVARFENVPFDAENGEVLVACQSHFAESFPRDLVFSVEVEKSEVARYTVHHRSA